jgi:hypothetical protein
MAAQKVVPSSFALALDIDVVLQEQLPRLTELAGNNTHALALAFLYRGFITLKDDHYPRDAWKYLFEQVMDLAAATEVQPPA